MDSSVSQEKLAPPLPLEMLENIFQYLTEAEDLLRVAQCNRAWREAANRDNLWRPLCRAQGWEHYGTIVDDLSKETASSGHPMSFPFESLVAQSEWSGLAGTCKWKEIYLKAWHLELNWGDGDYKVVSIEFGYPDDQDHDVFDEVIVSNLTGEGNYLAGGISNGTLRIWDASSGQCLHIIQVDVSNQREALKLKNGVIAVGCTDGKIRTYSAQTGEQLHVSLSRHQFAVSRLFFDGEIIVSVAQPEWSKGEADIRVWNSVDGTCRFVFQSSSQGTQLVDFDYLDKTVAGAYSNKTVRLWDAGNGTCRQTIENCIGRLSLCRLGDGIVITGGINAAKVWNSQTGECLKNFEVPGDDDAVFCEFSGEFLLATTSVLMSLQLFNLDGKYLGDTASHNEDHRLEATFARGNKLITSDRWGGDKTMHLWIMNHRGVHFIQQLHEMLHDEESRAMYYVAWMSHTKLAFVQYYVNDLNEQLPKVIVRHYW